MSFSKTEIRAAAKYRSAQKLAARTATDDLLDVRINFWAVDSHGTPAVGATNVLFPTFSVALFGAEPYRTTAPPLCVYAQAFSGVAPSDIRCTMQIMLHSLALQPEQCLYRFESYAPVQSAADDKLLLKFVVSDTTPGATSDWVVTAKCSRAKCIEELTFVYDSEAHQALTRLFVRDAVELRTTCFLDILASLAKK